MPNMDDILDTWVTTGQMPQTYTPEHIASVIAQEQQTNRPYEVYSSPYPNADSSYLHDYKSSSSSLNRLLRGTQNSYPINADEYQDMIAALDKVGALGGHFQEPVSLYRGGRIPQDLLQSFVPGANFVDRGF